MTGGWVVFLLSEVLLARLGVLDLRIIGNVAWVKLPLSEQFSLRNTFFCSSLAERLRQLLDIALTTPLPKRFLVIQ